MQREFIAYHNQTKVIVGIGATAADAIVDARWNVGNPDSDESGWQTIPADDDLIDNVHQFGGAVRWQISNNVAVLV